MFTFICSSEMFRIYSSMVKNGCHCPMIFAWPRSFSTEDKWYNANYHFANRFIFLFCKKESLFLLYLVFSISRLPYISLFLLELTHSVRPCMRESLRGVNVVIVNSCNRLREAAKKYLSFCTRWGGGWPLKNKKKTFF